METIKNTLAENFGAPFHNLAASHQKFSIETDVPDLSSKIACITGGSEGIGFGCTHTLLAHKIKKLFIISLREEVVAEAYKAIDEEFGAGTSDKIVWKQCDLSDWKQTSDVAQQICNEADKLDILINNAGRGIMTQQFAPTNGIDLHMAANHIGHVVLTSHLLPLLKKTAGSGDIARIVNLSSNIHEQAPKETSFESVEELQKNYGPNAQYGRSKLANLLYARHLARQLETEHPSILVNATFPGIVDTAQTNVHIHEPYPLLGYGMSVGLKPFRKAQFEGCVSTMYAATVCRGTGLYIAPPAIVEKGSDKSNDKHLADNLMNLTKKIIDDKTNAKQEGCPLTST